jgi:hypothetical protein
MMDVFKAVTLIMGWVKQRYEEGAQNTMPPFSYLRLEGAVSTSGHWLLK